MNPACSWLSPDSYAIPRINSLAGILSCSLPGALTAQHFERDEKETYQALSHAILRQALLFNIFSSNLSVFSEGQYEGRMFANHLEVMFQGSVLVTFSRAKLRHHQHLPKNTAQIKCSIQSLCPLTVWSFHLVHCRLHKMTLWVWVFFSPCH